MSVVLQRGELMLLAVLFCCSRTYYESNADVGEFGLAKRLTFEVDFCETTDGEELPPRRLFQSHVKIMGYFLG